MRARKYHCDLSVRPAIEEAVREMLRPHKACRSIVRVLFMGAGSSNENYADELAAIKKSVCEQLGYMPVVSYVIQHPLYGTLAMELTTVDEDAQLQYKDNYVIIDDTELVLGAVTPPDLSTSASEQSDAVFEIIGDILRSEGFGVEDIARQWNYIERITETDNGAQRYQDFNDSRSRFYAPYLWSNGYPAATGIGTQGGGIVIELDAFRDGSQRYNKGIDNPLQVAAHNYSATVLVAGGAKSRSTPKFDRARIVEGDGAGLIYISGTAAIRGQQSCEGCDAAMQTRLTMENIDFLAGEQNRKGHNIDIEALDDYSVLRVYIKYRHDADAVRDSLREHYPYVGLVLLLADVCRDELLVEIETTITIKPLKKT